MVSCMDLKLNFHSSTQQYGCVASSTTQKGLWEGWGAAGGPHACMQRGLAPLHATCLAQPFAGHSPAGCCSLDSCFVYIFTSCVQLSGQAKQPQAHRSRLSAFFVPSQVQSAPTGSTLYAWLQLCTVCPSHTLSNGMSILWLQFGSH